MFSLHKRLTLYQPALEPREHRLDKRKERCGASWRSSVKQSDARGVSFRLPLLSSDGILPDASSAESAAKTPRPRQHVAGCRNGGNAVLGLRSPATNVGLTKPVSSGCHREATI